MADEVKMSSPPAYVISSMPEQVMNQVPRTTSRKSKILFGYAVAITTALIVVIVLGGVYYSQSLDVIETALNKYKTVDNSGSQPVTQDVEIDTVNNVIVFRLSGDGIAPGTFAVLDYTKSLTAIYDPQAQQCYLIPGIDSQIVSPVTLNNNLAKNITRPTTVQTLNYTLGSDYPISDKTILPAPLKSACAVLPVYWMEKYKPTDLTRKKRALFQHCWRVWGVKVCVSVG